MSALAAAGEGERRRQPGSNVAAALRQRSGSEDGTEAPPQAADASARAAASKRSAHNVPRKAYVKLSRVTAAYAVRLRRDPDLASVIQDDLKAFRSIVERSIRLHFPLKRGRLTDPLLDAACRLIDQGK